MATLVYEPTYRLEGHKNAVVALGFNAGGSKLASVGIDGLFIWSVSSGSLLFHWNQEDNSGLSSVIWVHEDQVLAGGGGGELVLVKYFAVHKRYVTRLFPVHSEAIESLAFHRSRDVALGAGPDAIVVTLPPGSNGKEIQVHNRLTLANPAYRKRVAVTSLHWANLVAPHALVVSYLNHGVCIWDAETSQLTRSFPAKTQIGNASLSSDHRYLVVSNLLSGFDIYDLVTGSMVKTLLCEPQLTEKRACLPVIFLGGDESIVAGTTTGQCPIFHVSSEGIALILEHGEKCLVISLSNYRNPLDSRSLIACGTSGSSNKSFIQVWALNEVPRQKERSPLLIWTFRATSVLLTAIIVYYLEKLNRDGRGRA